MEFIYDIAIVGGGPAGLSAAITARSRNKNVILFDSGNFSERLQKAKIINNYPGLPGISGAELMKKFYDHAMLFSPTVIKKKVQSIFPGEPHTIMVGDEIYQATTVILCTGQSSAVTLPGEEQLLGRGVSYCATCDGMFFKNRSIAVYIDNKNDIEEVAFLAEICSDLHVLGPKDLVAMIKTKLINLTTKEKGDAKITFWENSRINSIKGEQKVTAIEITSSDEDLVVDGVFLLRETTPMNRLIDNIEINKNGVVVDDNMSTNIAGIYAAGDAINNIRQITKATGEGLQAAFGAVSYINQIK